MPLEFSNLQKFSTYFLMSHKLFVIFLINQVKIGAQCNKTTPAKAKSNPFLYDKRFTAEYFFIV